MNKEELISVFEDTKNQVEIGNIVTDASTRLYNIENVGEPSKKGFKLDIRVENLDTVSVARELSKMGKTAILNMASAKKPGGGVKNGAQAQEECLFRCSDLYKAIPDTFYPLDVFEGLYTKNASFFKDVKYTLIEPFHVDVITVAAVNLNPLAEVEPIGDYLVVTKAKIHMIIQLAILNECENLVLGAWGCGVFKNNPRTIAELFMSELKNYMTCFKSVVFAVINDNNSVDNNYSIFKDVVDYRNKNINYMLNSM